MDDTYDRKAFKAEMIRDEGRRVRPYYDSGMRVTVAIGRNLDDHGLSDDEIDLMFANDSDSAAADLDRHVAWWRTLDPARQRVLLNMCFNMGWPVFSQFARFFSAVAQHRWDDAAIEMLASRWATQVGDRATRLATVMRTGTAA